MSSYACAHACASVPQSLCLSFWNTLTTVVLISLPSGGGKRTSQGIAIPPVESGAGKGKGRGLLSVSRVGTNAGSKAGNEGQGPV